MWFGNDFVDSIKKDTPWGIKPRSVTLGASLHLNNILSVHVRTSYVSYWHHWYNLRE